MSSQSRSYTTTDSMLRHHSTRDEHVLKGIPASHGIAIGRAFVLSVESPSIQTEKISGVRIPEEIARFLSAVQLAAAELASAIELAHEETENVSTIIESYLMIVGDPILSQTVISKIEMGDTAEWALIEEFDAKRHMLFQARDPILRERAQDLDHVKERLLAHLRNKTLSHAAARDSIVVAGSMTPQDILFFKKTNTRAFITEIGGINSHSSILARDVGIPAVIGLRNATTDIPNGTTIIVDGYAGVVVVNPSDETLSGYYEKQSRAEEYRARLGASINEPTITRDGLSIRLLANIDTPDQVEAAVLAGCEGIGLVRTEYLLMQHGEYPSVAEQTEWYSDIAQRAYPRPVTFRAFDVGSDKFREGIPHHEDNPALGLRGIRFLLYRPDLFEDQICAVLRASRYRNVKFMLPMVTVLEELQQAKVMIETCKHRLAMEEIDFDPQIQIGVMVETPAAALMAETFAQAADFLSIGTNDLAQYALATDRTNEMVADIYDALHPAVIRMIKMVVDAGRLHCTTVSVCGELAGHAAATEMLIGLGISELSVSPTLCLELKDRIRSLQYFECLELTHRLMLCTTTQQVYSLLSGGR